MKKWVFRIMSILLIVAGVAFIVVSAAISSRFNGIINTKILNLFMIVVIAAAFWCLFYKSSLGDRGLFTIKTIILSAIGLLTVSSYFAFCFCIPKYTISDALAVLKARQPFNSADIGLARNELATGIEGNLFVKRGYTLSWNEDGVSAGVIRFDPITGEYTYFSNMGNFTLVSECFQSSFSQDFPFRPDNTVQINLSFNHPDDEPLLAEYIENLKCKESKNYKGLYFLEESDVKAFLQEMGEQKLRDQLDKIVIKFRANYEVEKADVMPSLEDMTINFSLYDVNIAAFHDGNITLKQ